MTKDTEFGPAWIPTTQEDKEDVRLTLEQLLEDSLFRRSGRYSALLHYIVEKALDGMSAELKERTIGIDVFHRPIDYDTNVDPVVRFCAGEIRKRLAQYYRTSTDAVIEIDVPIGSYAPLFRRRTALVEDEQFVPLAEPSSPEAGESVASPIFPGRDQSRPAISSPSFTRRRMVLFTSAIALILLCCIAFAFKSRFSPDPLKEVWEPFLNRNRPVTICTGTPYPVTPDPVTESPTDSPNLSIEEHFLQEGHRISLPTAATIAQISGFLEAHDQAFILTEAEANSLDNLRSRPLVLVNANNNKWTLLLLNPLRFHFQTQGNLSYIVDRDHPERLDWHVDFSKPYIQQTEDYAIVARLFNPTTKAPVMVLAGIGSNGTQAAGEFSVSPQALADLARMAPRGWQTENFEAVLKVEVIQGHLGATKIVAADFWKAN